MHHHLMDSHSQQSYISNDLLDENPINCLHPPAASFSKRITCCRPLFERPERLHECISAHIKHERQLAGKIELHRSEAQQRLFGGAFEPQASLLDCFFKNHSRSAERATTTTAATTAMPSWLTSEYAADNERTTTTPTAETNRDNGRVDGPPQRTLDDYRTATVDVLLCALGAGDAALAERWLPVIKRSFDVCQRAYNAAPAAERDQYGQMVSEGCEPAGTHVLVCMSERMFLECPREDWAQDGDGELAGVGGRGCRSVNYVSDVRCK